MMRRDGGALRVAHVAPCYWPATEWGGPTQSITLLAEALASEGVTVEVFTTTTRGEPSLARIEPGRRTRNGVTVSYFDAIGPRSFGFAPRMAMDLLRRVLEFDVVHLHGLWVFGTAFGARMASLRGVPFVVSPRGTLDQNALSRKALKKHLYLAAVERATLSSASLIHFTAEGERTGVPASLRSLPAEVVANPVDLKRFVAVQEPPAGNSRLNILMVGRIHPIKGFDLFVPALAEARARGVDAHLRIAGPDEGGYRAIVEGLVARAGLGDAVEFIGPVNRDELVHQLTKADIVAQPSYTENFGMATAEAMAAARPVIVSERVNLAPTVARAGGGLVVPLDAAHFTQAILEMAASPERRREMGARGRKVALQTFAPDAVARQMILLYERAMTRTKTPRDAEAGLQP